MKTVKKSNDILVDFDSYDTRGQHDFTWSERTRREDKAHRSFDRHFYPTVENHFLPIVIHFLAHPKWTV